MVKFRVFELSSGKMIYGGKNAENNDELVWQANPNDVLLHTSAPGSPFVNVGETPTKQEINEAAIFCAKFSQDWRDNKKDIVINKFFKKDTNKEKKPKAGSWTVSKEQKLKVKKADILRLEKKLKEIEDKAYKKKNEASKKTTNRKERT